GTLWPGLVAGVLFGLQFVLIFVGLEFTSVARSVLLANSMPFFVLIGGHFVLGEQMDARKFVGLVLAFAGVAVIFGDRLSLPSADAWIGDLMSLAAGALWAATTLVIKKSRLRDASSEKVLVYQLGISIILS
ncbi:EamA family transporter, partial [Rhizobiaceae sp. 2RAB30]